MSRRSATLPKTQSRRVAAWIYAVINPIVDALDREIRILDTENLTWRSNLGRCESIHSIQEYVDVGQWPNFQDFQTEHSVFLKSFDRARLRFETRERARAAKCLIGSCRGISFQQLLENFWIAYETARSSTRSTGAMHSTTAVAELPKIAAENVINNISEPPRALFIRPLLELRGQAASTVQKSSRIRSFA